jgi:hypothetical protein
LPFDNFAATIHQHFIMPTNKTYEYDYEWTGQEEKPKGVVLQEKNPWNKPNWGNSAKPASPGKSSFAA